MMNWILAAVTLLLIPSVGTYDDVHCASPQYLERGKRGIVKCQFPEVYYGIFWYNTTDYLHSEPIVYMKIPNEIGGKGYDSNEYNISSNGSLVINKVSLQDDRNFTAVVLDSPRDEFSPNNIQVIVTVKPFQMQPHIDGCNTDEQLCFKKMNGSSELSCSVTDARPSVDINWYTKTISTDNPIRSVKNVTFENSLYTTLAKTTYIPNINENVVYVCKSVSQPLLLTNEYSLVLVQKVSKKFENIEPTTVYAEHSTSIELPCTDQPNLYLLWRKTGPDNHTEDLISIVSTDNSSFSKVHSFSYSSTSQRSLHISEVDVTDEGLYICTCGDGIFEDVKKFSLQVYEMTDSAYPFVEGCFNRRYCGLLVPREGTLTCIIQGVRPTVELKLEVVKGSHKHLVTFFNDKRKVTRNGLKFEISLTSHFRIRNELKTQFAIKCTASGYGDDHSPSTRIYLTPLDDEQTEVRATVNNIDQDIENNENQFQQRNVVWIVILILLVAIIGGLICHYKRRNTHIRTVAEEIPLVDSLEGKISTLQAQLRVKYRNKYAAIQPLPYNKNLVYSIDKVFVESSMEQLEKIEEEERRIEVWKKLESHNQILDGTCKNNARVILEGDPGYGKSTLGFRFAYDWVTKDLQSPLKDVQIFILLRLRHLKDVSSIAAAVKQFLLPKDSFLTVDDVDTILHRCGSLVIYLDGFNRFPNQADYEKTILKDILVSDELSNSQVIITTRPSCLPSKYANITKRFRLTGFGEQTWRKYMSNVDCDTIVQKKVMEVLEGNPLLRDLCQVPLFFTLLTHIVKAGKFVDKSSVQTVTMFLSVLMDCFHAQIDTCEDTKHLQLCRICLDALLNNKEGLLWKKHTIRKKLGKALYDKYCCIGILVEEEFRHHNMSGEENNNNPRYFTKVRFFHNIFCEWYAACELSKVIAKSTTKQSHEYLSKINVFDHQYVFRFACGMKTEADEKIIKYVQSVRDGEKLAILCYVEQDKSKKTIDENLKEIFSSPVNINEHDTLFLRRATIELLEIAARHKVNIECVWLGSMSPSADLSNKCLKLSSGFALPELPTLNQLSIREPGRELKESDVKGLLSYANICSSLKSVRFRACLMPFCLQSAAKEVTNDSGDKGTKHISLEWKHCNGGDWYRLDFQSGQWKCDKKLLTESEYDEIKKSVFAAHNVSVQEENFTTDPGPSASFGTATV